MRWGCRFAAAVVLVAACHRDSGAPSSGRTEVLVPVPVVTNHASASSHNNQWVADPDDVRLCIPCRHGADSLPGAGLAGNIIVTQDCGQ